MKSKYQGLQDSQFSVNLVDSAGTDPLSGESPMPAIRAQVPGCSVYLIEDDQDLRRNLSLLLTARGFSVSGCGSAESFYRDFAVKPASVVVLDIGLPGEDGLSICRHLRTHFPLIGLIIVSARGMHEDRIAGLQDGADAYLVKPVEVDELVLGINRLADRHLAASALAAPVPAAPPAGYPTHTPAPKAAWRPCHLLRRGKIPHR